jgi:hypothetical protein
MAKELTPAQRILRKKARGLAEAAGKTWANLPRDERHAFVRQARNVPSDDPSQPLSQTVPTTTRAVRKKARAVAEMAGRKWDDLSREDRQNYLDQVRKQNG